MKKPQFTIRHWLWATFFFAIFMTLAVNVKFGIYYSPPDYFGFEVSWQDPTYAYSVGRIEGQWHMGVTVCP
jgi:hypothetical protein